MPHNVSYPSIILLLTLLSGMFMITNSTRAEFLSLQILKSMRATPSTTHHFIIVAQQLLLLGQNHEIDQSILPEKTPTNQIIKYYYTDCKDKILQVCEQHRNVPILMIYNRAVIQYQMGWGDKYGSKVVKNEHRLKEDIGKWVSLSIHAKVQKSVKKVQEINDMIKHHKSVFIMVENKTLGQNQEAFQLLAKTFPTQKFVYFKNKQIAESIQMDVNLTVGTFVHATYNKISQFPVVPKTQIQLWQAFVQGELFWGVSSIGAQLTMNRFNKTAYSQAKQTVIFCDLAMECLEFMEQLNDQIIQTESQTQVAQIVKNIVQPKSFKNPKIIELYYHLKLTKLTMPVVMVIEGESQKYRNIPARYVKQLNAQGSPLNQIKQFWESIESGNEKQQYLSSGIPKKNGFYGKGSQKLIQKVSYETYKDAILAAHKQNAMYFMYITANQFDCSQCQENYLQLRKFASYFQAEGWQYIKFGIFDLSTNQIDLESISGIPTLILFKPGSIDPQTYLEDPSDNKIVTYNLRYYFDSLMRFIQQNKQQTIKDNSTYQL